MKYLETPETHAALGIRYLHPEIHPNERCPICNAESKTHLTVPSIEIGTPLTYLKCIKCRTVFLPRSARNENFYQQKTEEIANSDSTSAFLKHYLEIGAGPDSMARILSPALKKNVRTFCSVGCGAGLDLGILATLSKGRIDIVGFEPNSYGQVEDLFVPIINDVLSEQWLGTTGRKFDIVFASEVIEHIPDPKAFSETMLRALSGRYAQFIFTTPNADLLSPENQAGDVYAALFPGEHKIIFTKESLENTLIAAGFGLVNISETKGRLTGSAQQATPPENEPVEFSPLTDPYIQYLRDFVSVTNTESRSPLMAGNSFRLLSELVNSGKEHEALNFINNSKVLLDLCTREAGVPVLKDSEIAKALKATSFDEHVRTTRGFLAPFAYYLAMLAFRLKKPDIAAEGFRKALQLLKNDEAISPYNFQISCSLINPCKMELINSLIESKNISDAIQFIQTDPNPTIPPSACHSIVRNFVATSNSGDFEAAKACIRMIDENILMYTNDQAPPTSSGGLTRPHLTMTPDPALLFDYHITRSYFELNVHANKESAKQQMRLAAKQLKEVPSFGRTKTLVKLGWLLHR